MFLLIVCQLFFFNQPNALSVEARNVEGALESEHHFTLEMEKDHHARIHVRQVSAKVAVSILSPKGDVVAANVHDYLILSPIFLSFKAHEKGVYTVKVRIAGTIAQKRGGPKPDKGSFKIRVAERLTDEAFTRQQELLKNDPRVAYVKKHAVSLAHFDPTKDNVEDLRMLKDKIGDARVVMIGDQTHFEAEPYAARMRLIKFLHQEMGFDVLGFESDIYSVHKLQRAIQNPKAGSTPEWPEVIAPWARFREFDPIMNYVNASAKGENPLEIIGFDSQVGRYYAKEMLADELAALALETGFDPLPTTFLEMLRSGMDLAYIMGTKPIDSAQKDQFFKTLEAFRQHLSSICNGQRDPDICFMAHCLDSVASIMVWYLKTGEELDADKEDVYTKDRSRQMAKNIAWFTERFKDKKIILLAANAHIQAGPEKVRESDLDRTLHPHFLMGKLVREQLGDALYTIGVTAYQGRFGPPRPGKSEAEYSYPLLPDQEEGLGLEEMFYYAGLDYAFLDFRNITSEGAWLNKPLMCRPFGHHSFMAKWPEVFDAMFFIKTLTPVHMRQQDKDAGK